MSKDLKPIFEKIFENYTTDVLSGNVNYLSAYNFLKGFMNDPIEFKYLNNSWCGLDQTIWEDYRSDYRQLSKTGVRQQIKDNITFIKKLANESIKKINFNSKRIKNEKQNVDIIIQCAQQALDYSQHYHGPTRNYGEDNTIECLKKLGYDV